ncbi:hypothetical protein [Ruminococcus sp. XPD3002]|uniref:hypothetical protein n=1 Tax=Ruminococcus sp. XPD3002 TaxID=1452269 RepID=UPI00091E893C|nr:hypothetical protein SAMN04487832_11277 [Ruminococcus flavefaciens]
MKANLQGTYYYSYYLGNESHFLEVKEDFLIDFLKVGESGSKKEIHKITKWNYRTGSFITETGGKYIVNDEGDFKYNKTLFTNIKKTLFNKDYVRLIPYSSPTSYDY